MNIRIFLAAVGLIAAGFAMTDADYAQACCFDVDGKMSGSDANFCAARHQRVERLMQWLCGGVQ